MAQPKSDIAPLLREAVALQDRGAFDQAVERCERALRQAPRSVEALHLLGVGECLRGRPEAGLKHFDRAIALAPGFAPAHGAKGAALVALRRHDEAVRPLRRAAQLQPGSAEAQMNLALALDGSGGDWTDIQAAFEAALRLRPESADAHYNYATVLMRHGRLAEAEEPLRRAVALRPALLEAWNNLGLCLRDLGRRDAAIAAWRQGVDRAPPGDKAEIGRAHV